MYTCMKVCRCELLGAIDRHYTIENVADGLLRILYMSEHEKVPGSDVSRVT